MNLHVVAEGIETGDQLRALGELGCHYAQGFYFSEPVASDATLALMREREDLHRAFGQLQTAGLSIDDLSHGDVMSCSPGPQLISFDSAEVTIPS
jgi:predicted signal transduction protein with EAL and GGDEF domain